jgi:hypothetical protein
MKFDKMAAKSKMASKTHVFVFLLSKPQFLPEFKILFCIRTVFLLSNICGRNREIKMTDWFKMASFLGKNRLIFYIPAMASGLFYEISVLLSSTKRR